jgi:hypothetical protein
MHCLLPLITLLVPLALAFPKGPGQSRHHDNDDDFTTTKTMTKTCTKTFPTLSIPSSFTDIDAFPTAYGSGTIFSYPTAFATGDDSDLKKRRRALLEGRKWKGPYYGSGTGTACYPKPTGGKDGDKDGDKDDGKDDGGEKHDGKDD